MTKEKDYQEYARKFKHNLQVLNRSPKTIQSYMEHVESFLNQTEITDIRNVSSRMITDYVQGLFSHKQKNGKPYSTATVCIKVRSIKRFFEYLEQENIIFINPAEAVKEPRKETSVSKPALTIVEVNKLLDEPDLTSDKGIRDRTILEVFYSTGIRLSELCNLSILDADIKEGIIRINNGKGSKDRVVPMGSHAVKALQKYITRIRPKQEKQKGVLNLFLDQYGNGISTQVVSLMIRTYARNAGIKKPVSAHTLRHTFGTHLVQNGADAVAVQRMLGHVSLKTTQVYIRALGIDVKNVHGLTHPRELDSEEVR